MLSVDYAYEMETLRIYTEWAWIGSRTSRTRSLPDKPRRKALSLHHV